MHTLLLQIKENKSRIFNVLKWLTAPLVLLVLYYQLVIKGDLAQTMQLFANGISKNRLHYFLLVILLMPVNLGTEAIKWKMLLKKSHHISFMKSFQSVFAGITLSIFTPKRVGEYAGRLLLLDSKRLSAAGSLFVGNFSQMIANLILGLFTTLIFFQSFEVVNEQSDWLIPVASVGGLLLLISYFNLDKFIYWFTKIPYLKSFLQKVTVISSYNNQTLFAFLSLSFLKYTIFILQFVLLLYAFGISVVLSWAFVAASCVFFVKTLLPVPASIELAARGSIAIYFFSFFTENDIGILVASIVLWIVNLALPAIIGSYFISKKRI